MAELSKVTQVKANLPHAANLLVQWYRQNRRDLPWRSSREPYRIWISEVMLQQTTVTAVIPYYERFLKRFPTVKALSQAPIEDVLEAWAGLGYYSRARNLHKAATQLNETGFPKTYQELIELPGFGPYTARAVASLAFDQKVGVLDGNVIRVLSRYSDLALEWWKPSGRNHLQEISDQLVQTEDPSDLNQGLMELGATICTPTDPACLLCPWSKICKGRKEDRVSKLPLAKPRRTREFWIWKPLVHSKGQKVALIKNDYAPFLKGHLLWPGSTQKVKNPPKTFDFRGSVTHHDIFVVVEKSKKSSSAKNLQWLNAKDLKRQVPSSLIRKVLDYL